MDDVEGALAGTGEDVGERMAAVSCLEGRIAHELWYLSREDRSQLCRRGGVSAGVESHLMAACAEAVAELLYDPLRASVAARRHTDPGWGDLGDLHDAIVPEAGAPLVARPRCRSPRGFRRRRCWRVRSAVAAAGVSRRRSRHFGRPRLSGTTAKPSPPGLRRSPVVRGRLLASSSPGAGRVGGRVRDHELRAGWRW